MNRKNIIILFCIVLVIRIIIAFILWPGADEAYYYVYSIHPDWSYFDHPPMVAWIGGMLPGIAGWISPLSIRLGPIILFSAAIYIFFLLSRFLLKEEEALMATAVFVWYRRRRGRNAVSG